MRLPHHQRHGFRKIEVVVVIAIIGVLCGLATPAVLRVREASNQISCNCRLKQLGLAMHTYHDTHGRFPVEDYDIAAGRVQVDPRWHEFSLFIGLLPYIEQGAQLTGTKGQWLLTATSATQPPFTASGATPIGTLLCASRRKPALGPRTDYAAASQWSMKVTHPDTNKVVWCNSILGAASMCATQDGQELFTGTTMKKVTEADGTANTILLAHKALFPADYSKPGVSLYDAYWGDLSQPLPYDHQRDLWDKRASSFPAPATLIAPMRDSEIVAGFTLSFGSSHSGAMPTSYADGSVRNFAYATAAAAEGRPVSTAQIWQALWGYNDGVTLTSAQGW